MNCSLSGTAITGKIASPIMVQEADCSAYVYAILIDGVVRYIGKGRDKRMFNHVAIARRISAKRQIGERVRGSLFYNKLAKAISNGSVVEPVIVQDGLSDDEAFTRERTEIEAYPDEQLWNVFSGGRGSTRQDCLKAWDSEERRTRHRETMAAYLARPDVRQRISEGTRRGLSDPQVAEARRAAQIKAFRSPENRAKKSANAKAVWLRDGYKEKFIDVRKAVFASADVRKNMSAAAARRMADPAYKAKVSASIRSTRATAEHKKKTSQTSKDQWLDPEYRAKTTAAIRASLERRKAEKVS